jgi:hypothetical protein
LEGDFMSWQDELAQLDSALASGQISADEYRTRRDRVIAQASGQSAPEQPQQQAGAEPTHVFRPVNPAQAQGFEDRTQVVPGQQGPGVDRTQVVGRGAGDADSTQIVPNMPPPQFPPRPAPPPWETHQPQQNLAPPPWANEELPPEFGQQSWPRQGPEVFEEKSGGGAGKTIGIIVAVVLVLALAGGAVWFFGFRDKGNDQAGGNGGGGTSQEQTKEKTSTKPPPPDIPEGPFIELKGEEVLNRSVPIAQAVADKQPTEQESALLQSNGVTEVAGLVTEEDGLRRGIWAFKLGDGADPNAALNAMDQLYQAAQFELVSNDNGILVRKQSPTQESPDTVIRAHYISDGYLVRVEVYGKDSANVEAEYTDLIAKETDKFPPAS